MRAFGAAQVDQLEPARNDLGGVFSLDRADIGLVDERQPQIGASMPHRERCRLDQRRQCLERIGRFMCARPELGHLAAHVAGVEDPEHDGALRTENCRRRRAADEQDARRRSEMEFEAEGFGALPARLDRFGQRCEPFGAERRAKTVEAFGYGVKPEPLLNIGPGLDPPVGLDKQKDRRRGFEQRAAAPRRFGRALAKRLAAHRGDRRPDRDREPGREHHAGDHGGGR